MGIQVRHLPLPPAWPVVLPLCRNVRLARLVDEWCPMTRHQHLTHGQVAEFVVLHLLQSAHRRPLYQLADWAHAYHLDRLYGCPPDAFNDDRVGRTLDALAPVLAEVETAVVTQALHRYQVDVQAIHWDLTHVTFAGGHDGAELITGGYGGGALHERQLKLSLHATSDGGLPVRHQAVPGHAHQAPFAPAMLHDLQQRLGRSDLILVSDRAGISYDNLVAYRRAGAHAVGPLQETRAERAQLLAVPREAFTELAYRSPSAREDRYFYHETTLAFARQKRGEPLHVRALFIFSTRKQAQDAQEREQQVQRALARLAQIQGYLPTQRRYRRRDFAQAQVEKAVPEPVRGLVRAEVCGDQPPFTLRWEVDPAALDAAAAGDGRYILVADLPEASPDEIFDLFKRQGLIERRFRSLKSDLQVHPLWLQCEARIQALLLLFVLALLVYTLLERCSERAGLSTPYYHKLTARELIRAFELVALSEVRIRGQPVEYHLHLTAHHEHLLQRLGFPDPLSYLTLA